MQLVDDYLRAIAVLLPAAQRDDIVAELRDTILSRVEAGAAAAGRALTDDEVEGLLRNVGHPLVVADRYRDGPRQVVGPALYPYWAFAVKWAIGLQLAVTGVVWFVRMLTDGDVVRVFGQAVASAASGCLLLVGIATVVAWAIERYGIRVSYLDRWRVRDLRMLDVAGWTSGFVRRRRWAAATSVRGTASRNERRVRRGRRRSPTGAAVADLVGGTMLLAWWIGLLHFGGIVGPVRIEVFGFDSAWLTFDWSALEDLMFWPVLVYGVVIVGKGAVVLARPRAVRLHGALTAVAGLLSIAIGAWLWNDSPLASMIRVDTVESFIHRVVWFAHGRADPIGALLMIVVAVGVVAGACRLLAGLWKVVVGTSVDERQPPIQPA